MFNADQWIYKTIIKHKILIFMHFLFFLAKQSDFQLLNKIQIESIRLLNEIAIIKVVIVESMLARMPNQESLHLLFLRFASNPM